MGKSFKTLTSILTLLMFISNFSCLEAENSYEIVDITADGKNHIDSFENYDEAKRFYDQHLDDYDNLTFIFDDEVLDTEYGVVTFVDKDNPQIEYHSILNGKATLNGSYTSEAAYLSIEDDLVYFKIAGDVGYIDKDEVKIIPYELLNGEISIYLTDNNYLRHLLKTNLDHDYYNYDLKLDEIPDGLEKNQKYFSYDGHFFYDDYQTMIDDYRANAYEHAVNAEEAYYNYFAYLPHRSYTNYSYQEINDYFLNELCLDNKLQAYDDTNLDNANDEVNRSQLFDELDSFFGFEAIYGANAMMLLSSALEESSYGKSFKAFQDNELYLHAAFDSEEERESQRYTSIDNSIYAHAKYYVSKLNCGVHSKSYKGSFFGDKASGMNVNYTNDPYWGEKVSSIYFNLDAKLGNKDRNYYALGIIENASLVKIYRDENLSDLDYELKDVNDFALILLDEIDGVYKIQTEQANGQDYKYNPQEGVGYLDADEISYILNEEEIKETTYQEAYFDFNEGELGNEDSVSVVIPSSKEIVMAKPHKDGHEFIGFNEVGLAEYKKINEIKVVKDINKVIYENESIDLTDGSIKVIYEDGTSKTLAITSEMIQGFDSIEAGDINILLDYCGVELEYPLIIKESLKEEISELISNNINSYQKDGTYNLEELEYIKTNLAKSNYPISMDEIRYLDEMLLVNKREALNYNYKESEREIAVSGLALSLDDPQELSIFKPFKDTYYVSAKPVSISDQRLEAIARAYDFEIVDSFCINVGYNLQKATLVNPIVLSIKLDNKEANKIYTVYQLSETGDIIKCKSELSDNNLIFMCKQEGDFVILSKDSVNTFDFVDYVENINLENSDPDNHLLFIEGGLIIVVSILGFIMIVIYYILNRKEEKIWNDYKKSLLEAESVRAAKLKN